MTNNNKKTQKRIEQLKLEIRMEGEKGMENLKSEIEKKVGEFIFRQNSVI